MQFEAIGTRWLIETELPISDELHDAVMVGIDAFDQTYSRFRDDSLVGKASRRAGRYTFPVDAAALVGFYQALYDATDGAVTPLVGDTLASLGYDTNYSFVSSRASARPIPAWNDVMEWHGSEVVLRRPVTLDFGAAGKGYMVDSVGDILERHGHTAYSIDASGDVRLRGGADQMIGLEDPRDTTRVIGTTMLHDTSICASATNRRAWGEGLHHVIDGKTAVPTRDVIATWAIHASTMIADGIATALFFVDAERLSMFGPFQFVRMFRDGTVECSHDFMGELFV